MSLLLVANFGRINTVHAIANSVFMTDLNTIIVLYYIVIIL